MPNEKAIYLGPGATKYDFFHEISHVIHYDLVGHDMFMLMLADGNDEGRAIAEKFVLDRILSNRNKFTEEEIKDAIGQFNKYYGKYLPAVSGLYGLDWH